MPDNIEECFRAVGLSMFPDRQDDLETDCSCPDWSNPCKHVAAVYLLLGEEFDRDPFLIFRMRAWTGRTCWARSSAAPPRPWRDPHCPPSPCRRNPGSSGSNPLTALPERDHSGPAIIPELAAALPQQLGRFPLWQGNPEFVPAMQDIYRTASQRAVDFLMAAEPPGNAAPESEAAFERTKHGLPPRAPAPQDVPEYSPRPLN